MWLPFVHLVKSVPRKIDIFVVRGKQVRSAVRVLLAITTLSE